MICRCPYISINRVSLLWHLCLAISFSWDVYLNAKYSNYQRLLLYTVVLRNDAMYYFVKIIGSTVFCGLCSEYMCISYVPFYSRIPCIKIYCNLCLSTTYLNYISKYQSFVFYPQFKVMNSENFNENSNCESFIICRKKTNSRFSRQFSEKLLTFLSLSRDRTSV